METKIEYLYKIYHKYDKPRVVMKMINFLQKDKCIYCDNKTDENRHFESRCCGRGMCQSCYDSLVGTEEQFQIDYMEEEDLEQFFYGTNIENKNGGDYICFECCDNGNVYKLK